jgi:hypothetical protein
MLLSLLFYPAVVPVSGSVAMQIGLWSGAECGVMTALALLKARVKILWGELPVWH